MHLYICVHVITENGYVPNTSSTKSLSLKQDTNCTYLCSLNLYIYLHIRTYILRQQKRFEINFTVTIYNSIKIFSLLECSVCRDVIGLRYENKQKKIVSMYILYFSDQCAGDS